MHEMTAANLRSAFGGESMAHMRYLVWGDKADEEGFPNVARLFRAIAYAERVHVTNHFTELRNEAGGFLVPSTAGFGLGSMSANLGGAIEGETFEIKEMYPAYKTVAVAQGEKSAETSFTWALEAEKIHVGLYQKAKQAVDRGEDVDLRSIQICQVCGYTVEGDAPERCPICKALKDKFKSF